MVELVLKENTPLDGVSLTELRKNIPTIFLSALLNAEASFIYPMVILCLKAGIRSA